MPKIHPSEALLTRYDLDRMTCELIPHTHLVSISPPLWLGVFATAVTPFLASTAAYMLFGDLWMGFTPVIVLATLAVSLAPLTTFLSRRRIDVELTTAKVHIRWRIGDRVTSQRTFPLASIRAVVAVESHGAGPGRLRIVTDDGEHWVSAAGAPSESLQWLAEEVMQAVSLARQRDAAGPPAQIEQLLSVSTREARARYLRQTARKQTLA